MNSKWQLKAVLLGCLAAAPLYAEITLQDTGQTLTGDMQITQDMGITKGTNLLHSFLAFNIDAGESATFSGSNSITNIIARVTGDSASQIDGLLRSTISDANLFLINPNGIAFGEGASIDINGSLHLSTANSITFADDSVLLVSDTGASGLTTAAPSAFGFGEASAGITFNGTKISVEDGDNLDAISLIGGDVTLTESSISLSGGDIEVVATMGETMVALDQAARDYSMISLGDITVSNEAADANKIDLDASGESAGAIHLAGDTVTLDAAFVFSDTQGVGTGGMLEVMAATELAMSNGARITTDTTDGGIGGDVNIYAGLVSMTGTNTAIAASTIEAGGAAGEIMIMADAISIEDRAQISSVSSTAADGGDITLSTGTLSLASGGQISGQATNRGDGANVTITASGAVSIDASGMDEGEESGIRVDSINFLPFFTGGDAGDITITAPKLSLSGGAVIAAQATLPSSGAPGAITLNVADLDIQSGSTVSTLTASNADAGAITINANTVDLAGAGSGLNSTARRGGEGGSIVINATELAMSAGAVADTSTEAEGGAGEIVINLTGGFVLTGSGTTLASQSADAGLGGSISVSAETIQFLDNGILSVTASGEGDAGNITLAATDRLHIFDGAEVQTNAVNSGGGNITVEVIDTIYLRDATLTASAGGSEAGDNGGNIFIDPIFLILDNASIVAQAFAGNGGIIELISENYIADINSFLDASSELGNDGEVRITSLDNSVTGVLGVLSADFDAVSDISADACSARNAANRSSLLIDQPMGRLSAPGDLTPIMGEDC
jgi:filamentous hemagglutinin family protein